MGGIYVIVKGVPKSLRTSDMNNNYNKPFSQLESISAASITRESVLSASPPPEWQSVRLQRKNALSVAQEGVSNLKNNVRRSNQQSVTYSAARCCWVFFKPRTCRVSKACFLVMQHKFTLGDTDCETDRSSPKLGEH